MEQLDRGFNAMAHWLMTEKTISQSTVAVIYYKADRKRYICDATHDWAKESC